MFAKATIAAGILAASLAFVPNAATAKTTVNVAIGGWGGNPCWHNRYRCGWGDNWHNNWRRHYHRPHVVYFYGGYDNGYYPPAYYPPQPARIGCGEARLILRDRGFGRIVPLDCGGRYMIFRARRGGHAFVLRVNAWSGGVVVLSRR